MVLNISLSFCYLHPLKLALVNTKPAFVVYVEHGEFSNRTGITDVNILAFGAKPGTFFCSGPADPPSSLLSISDSLELLSSASYLRNVLRQSRSGRGLILLFQGTAQPDTGPPCSVHVPPREDKTTRPFPS